MGFITNLIGGAALKYLLIAVAGLSVVAWIRYDAAAPYKREVAALYEAAQNKERLAKANQQRADAAETEKQKLQQRLQVLIDETNREGTACVFSNSERQRLLDLAADRG